MGLPGDGQGEERWSRGGDRREGYFQQRGYFRLREVSAGKAVLGG